MRRALYSLLLHVLAPGAVLYLWWRGRRQPAYRHHIGERFGRYRLTAVPTRPIWVHAVSVGETRAAEPLLLALRRRHPDRAILLTSTTPTGRATGEELFGGKVQQVYLPYDLPFAVSSFLDRFDPAVGVLMETELWPNLAAACRRRGIPLYLANARLSARSARGYGRFASLARDVLAGLAGVGAQTAADAGRLEALGGPHPVVTGNLKFDIEPAPAMVALGRELRQRFGAHRPVLLAASTREGEEEIVLDAWPGACPEGTLLVIVPRHPQRFDDVAMVLDRRGIRWQRRSAVGAVAGDIAVVLGDSMGEMTAYYGASDVAFVGGSLLPLGGQNLIEACAMGVPVLIGPHTFNFEEATALAIDAGAARRIADGPAMVTAAASLLGDKAARERMSAAALGFAAAHRGATARTLALIESGWLPPR